MTIRRLPRPAAGLLTELQTWQLDSRFCPRPECRLGAFAGTSRWEDTAAGSARTLAYRCLAGHDWTRHITDHATDPDGAQLPEFYAELKDKDGHHLGEKYFAADAGAAESRARDLLAAAHGRNAQITRIEVYRRTLTNPRAERLHEINL